ncbi:MAG: TRAP transporter small permease [Chloroflexi bacterium]|nr:TRAP transporter small permease [Chloroflexota bacterium]
MSVKQPGKIAAFFDHILAAFAALAAVILILITLGVTADIVMRYFLRRPITGMAEITEYSLLWITFLVGAWLLKKDWHIRMDILINRLKPRAQNLVSALTSFVAAIACLVTAWYGAIDTWESVKGGYVEWTTLQPPLAPIIAIIPIGSFLLFIQFLRTTYGYIQGWRTQRNQG